MGMWRFSAVGQLHSYGAKTRIFRLWNKEPYYGSIATADPRPSVAAMGMGQSRCTGWLAGHPTRVEEVKHSADDPVAHGDAENKCRNDGEQQQE